MVMTIMQGNTNHVLRIEALYVSECMRREALAWEFKIAEAYRAFIYIPYEKKQSISLQSLSLLVMRCLWCFFLVAYV